MDTTSKKLRVWHIPQVPMKAFYIPVENEREAALIMNAIALQHVWLERNRVIPDYSNAMGVEIFDNDVDGFGNSGWTDYWNEEEGFEWDEYENQFFPNIGKEILEMNK